MGLHLTLQRLKKKGLVWPNMRQHVHTYISQCSTCQKLRILNPCIRALPFVTAAPQPMERISVDAMGPFKTSVKGYEYILVVIDCFSRFVELYPMVTTSATETADRLLEYAGRYGQPVQILYGHRAVQNAASRHRIQKRRTALWSEPIRRSYAIFGHLLPMKRFWNLGHHTCQ